MGKPLFGGAVFGLATCGSLARDPQIDNLNHPKPRACPQLSAPNVPIRWRVNAELGPYAVVVLIRENTVGRAKTTTSGQLMLFAPGMLRRQSDVVRGAAVLKYQPREAHRFAWALKIFGVSPAASCAPAAPAGRTPRP
jgi:hypothetical protein